MQTTIERKSLLLNLLLEPSVLNNELQPCSKVPDSPCKDNSSHLRTALSLSEGSGESD